ncbi:MAG: hypothetical protein IT432_07200 [Phycisphaerales bacterium]|nr:hypothetical protein [Phycisphaerales bacterium]
MKKRLRLKSIARWTAWVLAVLLPVMLIFTIWGNALLNMPLGRGPTRIVVSLTWGALHLGVGDSGSFRPTFWECRGYPIFPADWWPRYDHLPGTTVVVLPLWMPSIVAIAFSVWFYRDHRREERERRLGCCTACGYDRSGLASTAPCPECGAAATQP